ncbi:MAG TPA: ABC transporter permease [Polyangiaceae bacterium]|nr:ABC transporter permease [Polyangiaceae bacterium]
MIGRILVVAWKELLQLRRDRLTLAMIVALPILQLLLFGYAIDTDVRHVPAVIYDQDQGPRSRDFVARLVASGFYDVVGHVESYDEIERALRSGAARVAVILPPRLGADTARGKPAALQLIVDGSDPQTVSSALDTGVGVTRTLSQELALEQSARRGQRPTPAAISIEPIIWYNQNLRTAVFIVPGLAGVILTLTMIMFTSMAIARERERGTLEQLIVSPIRGAELIAGKIAPYVAIGYLQLALILLAGYWVFGVAVVGSLPLLFALSSLFIAANLALGLVFSTIARTQQQAMQMSFFALLPNILLSGFMFPWQAMPVPVQWLSQLLPLTHFLRIIRGIVLKGAVLQDTWSDIAWMCGAFLFFVLVATVRFRKKLG